MLVQLLAAIVAIFLLRSWLQPQLQGDPSSSAIAKAGKGKKKDKKKKAGHTKELEEEIDALANELQGESPTSEHAKKQGATQKATKPIKPSLSENKSHVHAESDTIPADTGSTENSTLTVERAKVKEVKGVPMPVDSDTDEEHPQGDVLVIKMPAPKGERVLDPLDDGWERATAHKSLKPKISQPAPVSVKHYQPVQEAQVVEEPLTAKQRANRKKAEKEKAEKEVMRQLQEERLRAHRRAQEREMVWKPPLPKYIPKDNQWESGKLQAPGKEGNTQAPKPANDLFWE